MLFQANRHANKSANNWRLFFQALSLSTFAALFSTNALSQEIKLVSAGAGVTELVLALDAADELVAVDSTSYLPEHLASIAKLGYHRMLSAEGIMALSPTLVVGSEVMGPETTLNVLKQAKIEVVKLPSSADEKQLMKIGRAHV